MSNTFVQGVSPPAYPRYDPGGLLYFIPLTVAKPL